MSKAYAEANAKKKKKETVQQKQSPSVSKKTKQVNDRLTQKYGGGTTKKSVSKPVSKEKSQAVQTRLQSKYGGEQKTVKRQTTSSAQRRTNANNNLNLKQNQIAKSQAEAKERREFKPTASQRITIEDRLNNKYGLNLQDENKVKARQEQARQKKMGLTPEDQLSEAQRAKARDVAMVAPKFAANAIARPLFEGVKEAADTFGAAALRGGRKDERWARLYGQSEDELEKSRRRNDLRIAGLKAKAEQHQRAIQTATENAKEKYGIVGEYAAKGSATVGGQSFDRATGPFSLITMGMRVTEGQMGKVKEKTDKMKQSMLDSGNFTQEEVDELFKNADKWDTANAVAQGTIEWASEKAFTGFGTAAQYTPAGGVINRIARKFIGNKLTGSVAGQMGRGFLEEWAEEAMGGKAGEYATNKIYANKLQEISKEAYNRNKESTRNELANMIPEPETPEEAQLYASRINSDEFYNEVVNSYKEMNLSDKEAAELADLTREYLVESLSGNNEQANNIQRKLVEKLVAEPSDQREHFGWADLFDSGGSLIVPIMLGLPGAVNTSVRGNQYKKAVGIDKVKNLAKITANLNAEHSEEAQAIVDRIDSGKDVSGTQVYQLMSWANESGRESKKREGYRDKMVERRMKDERLFVPVMDRNYNLGPETEKRFEQIAEGTAAIAEYDMDEAEAYVIGDTVAAYETGTISAAQMMSISADPENAKNRAIFREMTGINLDQFNVYNKDGSVNVAKSNIEMQNALFAQAAENYMESARIEQENWNDEARGSLKQAMSKGFGTEGDKAVADALDSVDPRDRTKFELMGEASRRVYDHARNTTDSWDVVQSTFGKDYPSLSMSALKEVYESGQRDRIESETPFLNAKVKTGEAMGKIASGEAKGDVRGKFTNTVPYNVMTNEGRDLKASEQTIAESFSKAFNANTFMVAPDHPMLQQKDEEGNVRNTANAAVNLRTGEVFISANADFGKIVHEYTHIGAKLASEQYLDMAHYIIDKAYKHDPETTRKMFESYKKTYAGQNLTDSQIEEEMVADIVSVFSDDPIFVREISQENPSLAQRIYNAICDVLRALRNILATGSKLDPAVQDSLLAEIGAYEQTRQKWLAMMHEAQKNNAALGLVEWENKAFKDTRLSVRTTQAREARFSISEMPDIEELDQTNTTITDDDGNEVAHFQENGDVRFSISSFDKSGRDIYTKYLNKMVKNKELSRQEADDMLRELESVYEISKKFADMTDDEGNPIYAPYSAWSYADVIYDEKGKPVFSAIKKNSEYKMNIDFSTICKKRRTLDAVFREMINRGMFEKLDFNKDESAAMVVNINNLIRQHKFEAACALCFVEARRYRQQQTATTFRDMWNGLVESMYHDKNKIAYFNFGEDNTVEDVPDGIHTMNTSELDLTYLKKIANEKNDKGKPVQTAEAKAARLLLKDPSQRKLMRVGDMMASTGFENMQIQNPKLMKIYNAKKGTGGAKSSFGDVQYLNEIINSKTFDRRKAYAVSGVRIQSFSDYVPRMVFDYVQVVADLAAKKLPAHAYTKEYLFAYQFGLTGAKINLSLVPDVVADGVAPGLDANGNYAWNAEGTFPYDKAMELQKAEGYKDNCGTIAVGISDKQIWNMLADPTIQMVIPYHKSSLNPIVAAMTNVDRFTNYEDSQRTKDENGKALDKDFDWDNKLFDLSHDKNGKQLPKEQWGNVQDLVREYADWCKEHNYTPKFAKFLYMDDGSINPGYYKLLEDFALLDNYGNFKPQGDVQMRFPTEADAFGSMESLIKQGLTEDTELEAKRSNEIGGIVDEIEDMFTQGTLTEQSATSEKLAQKFSITPEMDEAYMAAVYSGNMEEAQRLVDEAAKVAMPNTKLKGRWYHGTENEFTEFNFSQGGKNGTADGFGIYLTNDPEVASSYGNRMIEGYVNVERPASALTTATLTKPELHRLIRRTVEIEAETLQYDGYDSLEDAKRDTWISNYVNTYSAKNLEDAIADVTDSILQFNGNDMDIIQEIMVGMGIRDYDSAMDFYDILTEETGIDGFETKWGDESAMADPNTPTIALAFRSSQIKSSDTVTYAEDGSIIPLSERFDPSNDDIRYSMPTQDADGNILSDGQMEYFKNSQARDSQGRLVPVYHTTTTGGFTVFDPSYSDDNRSLFFTPDRRMSESYSRRDGQATSDINPYDPTANIIQISNVNDLPDFISDEIEQRVRDRISNIVVTDREGNVVAQGDDFVEVAAKILPILEEEADYEDASVANDLENGTSGAMGAAWEVFGNAWEADLKYTMDFADMVGTYSCYLNLENPLIVRAEGADWSAIPFEGNTYDTRGISQIAFDRGYGGAIIKTVVDYSDYNYGSDAADVYIAFSSNQVKDTRNLNPTENPDIRYSIPTERETMAYAANNATSTDELWASDPIVAEGRVRYSMSKDDFINGKIKKWNPAWRTNGEVLNAKSVEPNIRSVIMDAMKYSDTDAKYRQAMVKDTVAVAMQAYKDMRNYKPMDAAMKLYDQAHAIIENLEFFEDAGKEDFERWKALRDYLRKTQFTVPEEDQNDIDYDEYMEQTYGQVLLKSEGTYPTDAWQTLNKMWPEMFTEDIKDDNASILLRIQDALNVCKPLTVAYNSEECESLASEIAGSLYDIIEQGKEYKSLADKYDDKVKAMKARHREAITQVKAKAKEQVARERERGNKRVEKEKAKGQARLERSNERWRRWAGRTLDKEKRKAEYKREKLNEAWKEKTAKATRKRKDSETHRKLYNRVLKEYKDLTNRLLNPSKDKAKNIPEPLRQPLAEMLAMFDLEKDRSKKLEEKYMIPTRSQLNFRQLRDALEQVTKENPTAYEMGDIYRYFKDQMTDIADRVDGKSIDYLTNEDIEVIKDLLKALNGSIKDFMQLEVDGEKTQAQFKCDEVAAGVEEHKKLYGDAKKRTGVIGWLDNIVNMGELTPTYFFRHIRGMYDMYKQLRKGFDDYIVNEKQIIDKLSDILAPYYKTNRKGERKKGSDIEEWRHSESAETFNLTYGSITLTVAQKMSLYCLNNRGDQARMHMFSDNGGVVAAETSAGSKIGKAKEMTQGKLIKREKLQLTPADVDTIVQTLTPEQIALANSLQKLMSEDMSALGNETSMKLLYIEAYKEKNYFPIKVQGDSRPTNIDDIGIKEKVRNPGFSNPLKENAQNPIVLDDIFTVVASHCNEMNLYASYAVPLTAFMKVYNGRAYGEDGNVYTIKELIRNTYGDKAIQYIENFVDDINGNSFKRNGGLDDVLDKALGQAKKAAVFANLRVAVQQPTAIVRAFAVMNPKYFAGVLPSAKATKEMFKYCPIAQWKAWGYYDTHFGRDIEDVMMGRDVSSMIDSLMSDVYGKLDNMTWGMIWQAVKNEVHAEHKDMDMKSEEFLKLCGERASFVFDSTQVVDSPFHRSNDMRSKNGLIKQMTSFQSEPTLSFNVLRQGFVDAIEAFKKGDSAKGVKAIGWTIGVWTLQALTVAFAQSLVDALRRKGHKDADDDEDEALKWYQELMKYFERNIDTNFREARNPLNNVYWIKDFLPGIINAIKGEYVYGQQNLVYQWYDSLTKGIQECKKKWEKGDSYSKSWYDCITDLFGAIGYMFGKPVKTGMRGTKNAFHWFNKITGATVFADDGSVDKAVDEFIDRFRSSDNGSGESEVDDNGGIFSRLFNRGEAKTESSEEADTDLEDLPDGLTEEQIAEIRKTEKRRSKGKSEGEDGEPVDETNRDEQTMLFDATKAAVGYEGEERDKKIWASVSKGYKDHIDKGDLNYIYRMKRVVKELGGDTAYLDEQVFKYAKTAMKKTIISDPTDLQIDQQKRIKDYLLSNGMSEAELSQIAYESDTKNDLKVAFRINDEDAIVNELVTLLRAGISRDDIYKIYDNRNKIDLAKYKNKGGKYADKLKSTGNFVWPTQGTITSHFGYRNAPTAGASSNHPAIDIGAATGTPVVAADGGVVITAGNNGGYGNSVGIKHDNGMVTYYNHLYSWNVKVGDTVAQGQQIAQVGSTGISTGPHLDFKILDTNGKPVDPEKYLPTN